jgi:anti-sigma B factor antagonist
MELASRELVRPRVPATGRATVVKLTQPEYSSQDAAQLARVRQLLLDEAEKPGPPYLVVDLSAVRFFGAGFIAVLVSIRRRLRKRNRRLALCGATPLCAELLQKLQLDTLFEIYPTLPIALDDIEGPVYDKQEETPTPPAEPRLDLGGLLPRRRDRWYYGRPPPCLQAARAW